MFNYLVLIPLLLAILLPFKVVVIFLVALYYGHVDPFFPYLSDSGTTHPEAGYFSFILIVDAILAVSLGWLRYKQIAFVCDNIASDVAGKSFDRNRILLYNRYSLYGFLVAAFGMASVSCFRSTEHLVMHGLSASIVLTCSAIVVAMQIWISYQLVPTVNSLTLARFRLIMGALAIVSLIIATITAFAAFIEVLIDGTKFAELLTEARLRWPSSWPGYVTHGISAIGENLVFLFGAMIFGSFIPDCNRIYFHNGKLKYKMNIDTSELNENNNV